MSSFNIKKYFLGDERATNLEGVSSSFEGADKSTYGKCFLCGGASRYKVIPKQGEISAEIEDKGYVCENCVKNKILDNKVYALKNLD